MEMAERFNVRIVVVPHQAHRVITKIDQFERSTDRTIYLGNNDEHYVFDSKLWFCVCVPDLCLGKYLCMYVSSFWGCAKHLFRTCFIKHMGTRNTRTVLDRLFHVWLAQSHQLRGQ